jgi:hypothetical protein
MRSLAFATAALIASAAAFAAQSATTKPHGEAAAPAAAAPAVPAAPPTPPKVFLDEGYSQPDITPGYCKNLDPARTACTIPAMTAGSYYVEAMGTSTATAEGAAQQLTIVAGDQSCTSTRGVDAKAPWVIGAARTLRGGCLFTFVTDVPVNIVVGYADNKATKDAKGPFISVRHTPWAGVLSAVPVQVRQQ